MTLPAEFLINNVPYNVRIVEGFIKDDDRDLLGFIQYHKQQIKLSDEMEPETKAKVLLHEVVHGILQEYGMTRHNKEDFVDRLSSALYDFISHNDLSFIKKKGGFVERPQIVLDDHQVARAVAAIEESVKEKQRTRKLPFIDKNDTGFNLSEVARITVSETQEPEHWKTGIKYKDDIACYKTRYECPGCNTRGTYYVPEDQETVECYGCKKEIQKIPSTAKGFPHQDDWGNFFITEGMIPFEN